MLANRCTESLERSHWLPPPVENDPASEMELGLRLRCSLSSANSEVTIRWSIRACLKSADQFLVGVAAAQCFKDRPLTDRELGTL